MKASFSVQDFLSLIEGCIANESVLEIDQAHSVCVSQVKPLSEAKETDVAFFFSAEYQKELTVARPGILITGEDFVEPLLKANLAWLKRTVLISCAEPYWAMAKVSEIFAPFYSKVAHMPSKEGELKVTFVHPQATVHPSVVLGAGVQVGAGCVLEEGVRVAEGSVLYPYCYLGHRVQVGKNAVLFPSVTLYENTLLGDRVRIHSGAVLGADGFGYATHQGKHQKIYHLGRVVIGNDVEIGAQTTIDRGTWGDSVIGNQVKIDNHCHLGHNVRVGEGAILCGGVLTAGGVHIGKYVYLGGGVGVGNRVEIGDFAKVGGLSALDKDVPPHGMMVGNPAREKRAHFRIQALLNKMLKASERKKGEGQSS